GAPTSKDGARYDGGEAAVLIMRGDQFGGRLAADPGTDLRDVLDRPSIDLADQPEVARVARPGDLARRPREPRHDRPAPVGGAPPPAPARAVEVARRWHVDRMRDFAARDPRPVLGTAIMSNAGPAPVMRQRKPPRHVVDPVPAPRRGPPPMSVMIGRPIVGDA